MRTRLWRNGKRTLFTSAAIVTATATDLPLENERPARSSDYGKARAAVQIFEARLKELKYEERAKNLVPARDVADAAYCTISCLKELA
jgi:hypothetical protein